MILLSRITVGDPVGVLVLTIVLRDIARPRSTRNIVVLLLIPRNTTPPALFIGSVSSIDALLIRIVARIVSEAAATSESEVLVHTRTITLFADYLNDQFTLVQHESFDVELLLSLVIEVSGCFPFSFTLTELFGQRTRYS